MRAQTNQIIPFYRFKEKHMTPSEPVIHYDTVTGASGKLLFPLAVESGSSCCPGAAGSRLIRLE